MKGQILADFLVEKPDENPPNTPAVATLPEPWTLFTDGLSCVDGSGAGKLGPKWEGPYEVTEALGDGAYKLQTMDNTDLPRTWNIANLKKCYL
ncbi:hypothetical protein Tco_1181782 [Tanacetum coccineum]